jgi:Phage protein Gp138 N-terminal domain
MDDIVNLLKKLNTHIANNIRVCMPAKIETYDFKTQQASVKIDMQELFDDNSSIDYPVISGVPVIFMASGGASITMPVNRGDYCLLVFSDRDLSNWLLGGEGQKPDSTRMHDLSDAVAIMGMFPFNKGPRAENNTDMVIKYDGSKITLKPEGVINIETTKNINIQAVELININSKNAVISTIEDTKVNCKNITVASSESVIFTSKNTNITTTEDIKLNCRNASIVASEDVDINCKNANIISSGDATIDCENLTATVNNNIISNSATTKITTNGNLDINCTDATIIASNNISTKSTKLIHTGDISITGNLELGGTGSGANGGALQIKGGINNTQGTIISNGVVLETHTHRYNEAVAGSTPTVVILGFTGIAN